MIEVLKQALEALKEYVNVVVSVNDPNDWRTVADGGKPAREAITSLRQAIAELESQEPVAVGEVVNERGEVDYISYVPPVGTALYTTPPAAQRQWVGLTDEEITALKHNGERYISSQDFARAVEAKLKQKNGFAEEKNT